MELAPVILFAYNRPNHIKRAIESLLKNKEAGESDLFVFSDAPKREEDKLKVEQVREYLHTVNQFQSVTIIEREFNYGLGKNIIAGVTQIVAMYGKVIVLEDDLLTSPFFLQFMNEALDKYEYNEDIISIHGYCLPTKYEEPVYFLKGADCWGWATWERGWKLFNDNSYQLMKELKSKGLLYEFDFNGTQDFSGMLKMQISGKVNSWAIRWYASAFLQNKLTLYPGRSLVRNIGGDGSGTHIQSEKEYLTELTDQKIDLPDIPIVESRYAKKLITKHFFKHMGVKARLRKIFKWGY